MKIKILSDSTCDLSREQIAKYDIHILPLAVAMGENNYRDGVDIAPEQIFAHVANGGGLPKTAANNIADYQAAFEKYSKEYDAVIHLNISAEFSSCHQNACAAAADFENVYVVDSRNLSTGHGLLVIRAYELAESGKTGGEIAEELRSMPGAGPGRNRYSQPARSALGRTPRRIRTGLPHPAAFLPAEA